MNVFFTISIWNIGWITETLNLIFAAAWPGLQQFLISTFFLQIINLLYLLVTGSLAARYHLFKRGGGAKKPWKIPKTQFKNENAYNHIWTNLKHPHLTHSAQKRNLTTVYIVSVRKSLRNRLSKQIYIIYAV